MLTDRGLQRGELLLEHLDDKWRQAFRRLVEEQDLGVHHHRAGDGEHVLLAAAQRARPLVSPVPRALTGAAPVSCSTSMRCGCTRIRLPLSPRCHQRFDGWLRRERISSGKSANYLSTQNPWASMPSATLNLLRKFSSAIAAVSLRDLLLRRAGLHPPGCVDVNSEGAPVDERHAQVDQREQLAWEQARPV